MRRCPTCGRNTSFPTGPCGSCRAATAHPDPDLPPAEIERRSAEALARAKQARHVEVAWPSSLTRAVRQ